MTMKERAPLGFGDELDSFDPLTWTNPKAPSDKLKAADTRKAAEAAGFRSREPHEETAQTPKMQRRRRTGRNVQFNIKTKQEVIDAFVAVADLKGWGIGETFEKATELLIQQHKSASK
ncbi:stability/partitioning determinant [Aureimonas pseudogalii]|uniref:Stability/partitioning determinant n=1 Tax=Aureimonas pseudogalii TaxID=1744844 RepID=A0A7W6MLY9_9HYPH|nr:stability/partitioning determinant [Aureimonas pseudogalii]MBB4000259.1 hypothetical protein [Aureimonas pseudogalii]